MSAISILAVSVLVDSTSANKASPMRRGSLKGIGQIATLPSVPSNSKGFNA